MSRVISNDQKAVSLIVSTSGSAPGGLALKRSPPIVEINREYAPHSTQR